jgi:hypothetical protein
MSWLNDHLVTLQPDVAEAQANREDILILSLHGENYLPIFAVHRTHMRLL